MRKISILLFIIFAFQPLFAKSEYDRSNKGGRLIDLRGTWKFSIGDDKDWKNNDFDDSKWDRIQVPSAWEEQGYHGYDGYAWYRKSFNGQALKQANDVFFRADHIDDTDEIYVNGKLIGKSGLFPPYYITAYYEERNYFIPSNYINYEGENVISVRVYDAQLSGGIMSDKIGVYMVLDDFPEKINLEGVWEMKLSGRLRWTSAYYREWNPIQVPMNLRKIGIEDYNNVFWYQKFFTIPEYLSDEELMLVVGKIDDFDETYINGHKIGETNDHRPFGQSYSWEKTRVYPIPKKCLEGETNHEIKIKVTDIGVGAGIYAGPIAIVPRKHLLKFFQVYRERKW